MRAQKLISNLNQTFHLVSFHFHVILIILIINQINLQKKQLECKINFIFLIETIDMQNYEIKTRPFICCIGMLLK